MRAAQRNDVRADQRKRVGGSAWTIHPGGKISAEWAAYSQKWPRQKDAIDQTDQEFCDTNPPQKLGWDERGASGGEVLSRFHRGVKQGEHAWQIPSLPTWPVYQSPKAHVPDVK
jgi:hypothetical protein